MGGVPVFPPLRERPWLVEDQARLCHRRGQAQGACQTARHPVQAVSPKPTQKELDAAKEAELKRKARSAAGVAVEASDVERWLGDFEEIVPMAPVQVEAHDRGGASCVPAPPGPGDAGSIPVPADANPSCLDTRATLFRAYRRADGRRSVVVYS